MSSLQLPSWDSALATGLFWPSQNLNYKNDPGIIFSVFPTQQLPCETFPRGQTTGAVLQRQEAACCCQRPSVQCSLSCPMAAEATCSPGGNTTNWGNPAHKALATDLLELK